MRVSIVNSLFACLVISTNQGNGFIHCLANHILLNFLVSTSLDFDKRQRVAEKVIDMATFRIPRFFLLYALLFLALIQSSVHGKIYQVGDLDAWGIPTESNPNVYSKWSKNHEFKIGDSLCKLIKYLYNGFVI